MANQTTSMTTLYENICGRMYGIEYDYQIEDEYLIDLIYIKEVIDENIKDIEEWDCECCNIKVKYSKTKYHLNSRKHLTNYKPNNQLLKKLVDECEGDFNKLTILEIMNIKLLVERQIKIKKEVNDMFECLYCEKTLKKSSINQHLKSANHKVMFNWNLYGWQ